MLGLAGATGSLAKYTGVTSLGISVITDDGTSGKMPNFYITSASPGITSQGGFGAGTGATFSLTGSNIAGKITVITGSTATTGATVAKITYSGNFGYPNGSAPIIGPGNTSSALLSGTTLPFTVGATSSFSIVSGSTALSARTTYVWYYNAIGW